MNRWPLKKLGDLCSRIGDGLHGTPDYVDCGDIFFVNGNNLKKGSIFIAKDTKKVSQREHDKNWKQLDENTLLISLNGTLGSLAFYNGEKIMLGKSAGYLNFHDNLNRFYYYYFQLDAVQEYFYNVATGSTIKNLGLKSLSDFFVPVPDDAISRVQILELIDKKIDLNNQINAELESMAKLIYDYWFVQFDFPISAEQAVAMGDASLEGRPYKSSGGKMLWSEELKREIPEGWGVGTMSSYISNEKGGDWGKAEVQGNYQTKVLCIRGADLNGLNGRGAMKTPERYILEKNEHKILAPNELIVEISGGSPTQSTGRLGFIIYETLERFENPIICSNFCKAISLRSSKSLFNFKLEWERLYDHGVFFGFEGKTSGIKNFLFDSFVKNFPICLPPNNLMGNFYEKMLPMYQKQQANLKENQELSSLRDWLLPMLMNGQVRVEK